MVVVCVLYMRCLVVLLVVCFALVLDCCVSCDCVLDDVASCFLGI